MSSRFRPREQGERRGVTIVGKAENRSQTRLSKRPDRTRRVIEIQNLFKSDELVEGERLREVRAIDIDVEEPPDVFRNHQSRSYCR